MLTFRKRAAMRSFFCGQCVLIYITDYQPKHTKGMYPRMLNNCPFSGRGIKKAMMLTKFKYMFYNIVLKHFVSLQRFKVTTHDK